jgi:hypothetical protein
MVLLALLLMAVGGFIGISLVLVGLFEAPWPILLGLLLLGLYGLQRFSAQSDQLDASTALSAPDTTGSTTSMPGSETAGSDKELIYRGIHYHKDETPEPAETPAASEPSDTDAEPGSPQPRFIEGVYRGKRWRRPVNVSAQSSDSSHTAEVIYRGHKVKGKE